MVAGKIRKASEQFLQGHWSCLATRLPTKVSQVAAACKPVARAPNGFSPGALAQALRLSQHCNLRKALQQLIPPAPITLTPAQMEQVLLDKHPDAPLPSVSEFSMPAPDLVTAGSIDIDLLCKHARSAQAKGGMDQWGWQIREHISVLLEHPFLHGPLLSSIVIPYLYGRFPTHLHGVCIRGRLLAWGKPGGGFTLSWWATCGDG